MNFETLESRRLLSATPAVVGRIFDQVFTIGDGTVVNIAGQEQNLLTSTGTLLIKGTDNPDQISVIRDGNLIKFDFPTGSGGLVHMQVAASKVKRVLVEAGGSADKVFIDDELQKPCTVNGGSGSDTIEGNTGATLIGGSGNDRLSIPASPFQNPQRVTIFRSTSVNDATGQTFVSFGGAAVLSGGDGDDLLVARVLDTVTGGKGNDKAVFLVNVSASPGSTTEVDPKTQWGDRASGIELFASRVITSPGPQFVIYNNAGDFVFHPVKG